MSVPTLPATLLLGALVLPLSLVLGAARLRGPALLSLQSQSAQGVGEQSWARGGQDGPRCGSLVPQKQESPHFFPKAGPRSTEQHQNSPEPPWTVSGGEASAGWGTLGSSWTCSEGWVRNRGLHP